MKKYFTILCFTLSGFFSFGQINTGLVAKYYFNGNANDESGNGYDADTVTATLTTDRCGNANQAYSFDGTQFINIPYSAPFNSNDLSVSVWFRTSGTDSAWQRIMALPVGGLSGNQHFSINYNGTLEPNRVMIYFDPGPAYSAAPDTVNDNQWHHFAGIINSTSMELISFLDGIAVDTNVFTTLPVSASGAFQIGRFNNLYNQNFFGDIDDIRIYNKVLTAIEVDSLFNEGCSVSALTSPKDLNIFSVYPNPCGNLLNIEHDADNGEHLVLYNSFGQLMKIEAVLSDNVTIDLSPLPKGIYFYSVFSEKQIIHTGKLLKQ